MKKGIIGHVSVMFAASFGAMGDNNPRPIRDKEEAEIEKFLSKKVEPPLSHGKRKFLINGQVVYAISEKHASRKFRKKTGSTINTIRDVKD